MQTIYQVKDAKKIDLLIGDCKTTEVMATFDQRSKALRTRRIGDAKLKLFLRDYDGSEFVLLLNIETGILDLIAPHMKGSDYEVTLMQQLWKTISRLFNAGMMFISDPEPGNWQIDVDLNLIR